MSRDSGSDARLLVAIVGGLLFMYVAGGLPMFWSSLAAMDPQLPSPVDAMHMWAAMFGVASPEVSSPSSGFAWRVDAIAFGLLLTGVVMVGLRVDRWRGAGSHLGRPSWDPRSRVQPRPLARPRDLLHLQSGGRRWAAVLLRALLWDRRRPQPAGGDAWPLGRISGRRLRSASEIHALVTGASRTGKSSRVLAPALREHAGPAVVLLNKVDVLGETIEARAEVGPVRVYAPTVPAGVLPVVPCAWSPLSGCRDWEGALRLGRWLHDADPGASRSSEDSGGARFYNREAVATVVPALAHAAALDGREMSAMLGWLRRGVDGLDEPRRILDEHDAFHAADLLAGVQALDERPRSLLLVSAAQLLDALRLPSVQAFDHAGFEPEQLLRDGGTLYLVAPVPDQELLAPLFGAILNAVLRVWEQHADRCGGRPTGPLLKVFADEAAHLAPLRNLPTLLSVSAGWGVRWMLVLQSLSQARARWGEEADSLLNNTQAKLFLGPIQDQSTARYLGEVLDKRTGQSRSHTSRGWLEQTSTTFQEVREPVASAQTLMRLRSGEAILLHGHDVPAVVRLPAPWQRRGWWWSR